MRTIIRDRVARKLVDGKDSTFCIRNRQVKSDKINRYKKRKKVSELELLLLNEEAISGE